MASYAGIEIKVNTAQLVSTASDVDGKISRLEQALSDIERQVRASRNYWEGDGASAYLAAYRKKTDTIRTALKRFRENVTDLREIAGVYDQVERTVTANNTALSSNWID